MSKTTWTPEEQAAHRELWAEALLSGRYPQVEGFLKANDGFCCLGVACELGVEAGIVEWVETDEERGYRATAPELANYTHNDTLPNIVRHWLGLSDVSGETVEWHDNGVGRGKNSLTELNDELKWDFRQIGELIRAGGVRLEENS